MKKHSTLIYFVNNFKSDQSASNEVEKPFGSLLTTMDYEPSESSIKSILDFARSYEVLETKNAGLVEMILN